ncbi:UDP-N-acetylglucosamine 2-epimerase [Pedobacter fastidiosus]|uniref:UDP-N-acetylglucosamine 2-epimerase (Hydrolyzing) n=1 Tax=Pedobacter fastidiosus TaxID=2765361 RepID=A0ABR7KRH5_9SPHI|nr:UDP-N-acetylglucosamine 2-epimerase [Pedobacter fastidiosus]MBC6110559.1 UDP-N-acetylglucosamine 2-epimerase (hydrolyzing) [Pedobacter fastidiosus]
MRIAILTSSRADYGIYLPLIKKLKADPFFELSIIAFGTHLSPFHGETIKQIQNDGFEVKYKVESMLLTDSPEAVATAVGLTMIKFADFWQKYKSEFDLVFCLGDRYEMFAAVTAGIPFQIPFAHIHGGETTLGAIDNVFRHAITLASSYHFVATTTFAARVEQLTGSSENIYHVGALSLDNITTLNLLSIEEFKVKWGIDLSKQTILTTFHPETVAIAENENYINEIIAALDNLTTYQVLITMPNADTAGSIIRTALTEHYKNSERVFLVENLGSQSYFTAMKYAKFLLGNTSSGIIEAASFHKFVINLGNRQEGRLAGENVIQTKIKTAEITKAVQLIESKENTTIENIYYKSGAADQMIKIIKSFTGSRNKLE